MLHYKCLQSILWTWIKVTINILNVTPQISTLCPTKGHSDKTWVQPKDISLERDNKYSKHLYHFSTWPGDGISTYSRASHKQMAWNFQHCRHLWRHCSNIRACNNIVVFSILGWSCETSFQGKHATSAGAICDHVTQQGIVAASMLSRAYCTPMFMAKGLFKKQERQESTVCPQPPESQNKLWVWCTHSIAEEIFPQSQPGIG